MGLQQIVLISEQLYSASPQSIEDTSRNAGIDADYLRRLKGIIDRYLETDDSLEQIAQEAGIGYDIVSAVLRRFTEKCANAYRAYLEHDSASLAWAAEQENIGRFYFEDFFWRKAHLVDDVDKGRYHLEELTKILSEWH